MCMWLVIMERRSSTTTQHETWGCLAESEAQGGSALRVLAGFWAPGFQAQFVGPWQGIPQPKVQKAEPPERPATGACVAIQQNARGVQSENAKSRPGKPLMR